MQVLFVAQYGPLAASSRTRVFDYLPLLHEAGVDCDLRVVAPDALVRLNNKGVLLRILYYVLSWLRTFWMGWFCVWAAYRYDAIFIQKILFSFPIPLLLRRFRHKVLFDFDDAIFTLESPDKNWLNRMRTRRRARGLPAMLKASGHVIVENAYTADFALQYCNQVSQITGPIDTERYSPGNRAKKQSVVLGWIGSPWTTLYLDLIWEPLKVLAEQYPNIELRLIGAGHFDVPGLTVCHQEWTLTSEVENLRAFDIGLMPLPDDPFTKGKGGYKLLQYMAMGLPVVASPVEINQEIVTHGETGFLAQSDAEWIEYVAQLIKEDVLRKRMGVAGRAKVEAQYSLKKSCVQLQSILAQCVKKSI